MTKSSKRKSSNKGKIKLVLWVFAIIIAVVSGKNIFDLEEKSSVVEAPEAADEVSLMNIPNNINNEEIDLKDIVYEKQAHPRLAARRAEQIISHTAFHISYNKEYKVPNWVFYELTREETYGKLERSNNFLEDPAIRFADAAHLDDYRHSGWDRGHMAPSMDMNWDAEVLDECYLLSNMCPQGHDFNAGIWLDLEHQVRYWAKRDSAICVVCGPVLPKSKDENYRTLGKGKVLIPEYFYKIVLAPFAKKPRAIAFIMPNKQQDAKISTFAVTVDSVESLTGIDFFPILPDYIEDAIESQINLRDWFRKRDIVVSSPQ